MCAGPAEPCFLDTNCSDVRLDVRGGHGCNAGGAGQLCRFCGFSNPGGETFMPCPNEPTIAVLMPKVVLGEICPSTCTGNPAETCFYDAKGCTGGVDTIGCGAGGYVNCRFCGFGSLRPCPPSQDSSLVTAALARRVLDLLPSAVGEGTHVQVDVSYLLDVAVDLMISDGSDDQADEARAQQLLAAFRAVMCGTPAETHAAYQQAQLGTCLATLNSMAASSSRRRLLPQDQRLLRVQLQTQSGEPLSSNVTALALNATLFNEAIAARLRAYAFSPTLLFSVHRLGQPLASVAADVRLLRFSDSATERRDLETVVDEIPVMITEGFTLNLDSPGVTAGGQYGSPYREYTPSGGLVVVTIAIAIAMTAYFYYRVSSGRQQGSTRLLNVELQKGPDAQLHEPRHSMTTMPSRSVRHATIGGDGGVVTMSEDQRI